MREARVQYYVVIHGVESLFRNLENISLKLGSAMRRAMEDSLDTTERYIMQHTPIGPLRPHDPDHQKLIQSFRHGIKEERDIRIHCPVLLPSEAAKVLAFTFHQTEILGRVENTAPHARYVEYGTIECAPIRPRGISPMHWMTEEGDEVFAWQVRGQKPQPFMRRAFDKENVDKILEAFRLHIVAALMK